VDSPGSSAYLLQFDPEAGVWHERGTVVDQLKAAGLYRQGEGQNKIHSKIVPGAYGWLYFASTDEEGETDKMLPRWGGHLWRTKPDAQRWQHVLAVPGQRGVLLLDVGGIDANVGTGIATNAQLVLRHQIDDPTMAPKPGRHESAKLAGRSAGSRAVATFGLRAIQHSKR